MTKQEAIDFLVKQEVPLNEAEKVLQAIDIDAVSQEVYGVTEMELWDRHKPINNVPAEQVIKSRHDIPKKGEIILIKVRGQVRYFQPHMPNTPGFRAMTRDVAMTVGTQLLNRMRDEHIQSRLLEAARAVAPSG